MEDKELLKYGKYLTSLISSVILNTAAPAPFDDINWVKFFNLAKKHDVSTLIYPIIQEMDIPEDVSVKFKNIQNRMIARTTRQNIETEVVTSEFEKNSIKYIKLKGAHIKDYYPYGYIRTFSDIDLYIDCSDKKKAEEIMERLGYTLSNITEYHDEYEKDNFYIFELHCHIVSPKTDYYSVFETPFDKSYLADNNNFCYKLKNEYLFLHLLFHLHKHFFSTGCGIRLFVDLLVFEKHIGSVDWNFIISVIKQYDILDFYNTIKMLMNFFFFNQAADNNIETIANYIFESSTTGIYKYNVASLSFWGKIKYFLKVWFPPAKELAYRYPVLNKAPVLLPTYWIRRILYSLFFKRSSLKKQIDGIKTANSSEYKNIKKIRKMADDRR